MLLTEKIRCTEVCKTNMLVQAQCEDDYGLISIKGIHWKALKSIANQNETSESDYNFILTNTEMEIPALNTLPERSICYIWHFEYVLIKDKISMLLKLV